MDSTSTTDILQRSQSLLTAAMLATEQAEELTELATKLAAAINGLDQALQPALVLHTSGVWSGAAAAASRQRLLGDYRNELWFAHQYLHGFVAELRAAANHAQFEADQLWKQWRLAVYSGQLTAEFNVWG